jgi:hypothetical protein
VRVVCRFQRETTIYIVMSIHICIYTYICSDTPSTHLPPPPPDPRPNLPLRRHSAEAEIILIDLKPRRRATRLQLNLISTQPNSRTNNHLLLREMSSGTKAQAAAVRDPRGGEAFECELHLLLGVEVFGFWGVGYLRGRLGAEVLVCEDSFCPSGFESCPPRSLFTSP